MGKWLTQDLIGYPDGWNNFAYCGNTVNTHIDFLGTWATGREYSIEDPNTPWGLVLDTRTPSRDKSLAENAAVYFWWNNAPLSKELVSYVISSTASSAPSGYNLGSRFSTEIKNDVGFNVVNNYVKNKMKSASDGTVTFNDKVSTTLSSNYDLAHSIHGVNFTLTGQITKTDGAWTGELTISYSDPYDFNMNDPDWAVRVFGRLYAYDWITKFNVNGSFKAYFSGGDNEAEEE